MLHTYWKYPKHYWSAFEEESSVCSICSPTFLLTFKVVKVGLNVVWMGPKRNRMGWKLSGVKQGRGRLFKFIKNFFKSIKIEFTQVFHATYLLEVSQILEWI